MRTALCSHIVFKLTGISGAVAFFAKAGFNPPLAFVVLAIVAESICAVALTLGILTKWAGLASAAVMAVAAYATVAAKGEVFWLWNLGGIGYVVLWGALSILVAIHAWRQEHRFRTEFSAHSQLDCCVTASAIEAAALRAQPLP